MGGELVTPIVTSQYPKRRGEAGVGPRPQVLSARLVDTCAKVSTVATRRWAPRLRPGGETEAAVSRMWNTQSNITSIMSAIWHPPPSTKQNEKAQRAKGKRGRRPCSREGCPNQAKFRGVCIRHYQCLFVAESKGQCAPTRLRPPPHWLAADSWKECVANVNRWNKLSSEDQNREFLKYKTLSHEEKGCLRKKLVKLLSNKN